MKLYVETPVEAAGTVVRQLSDLALTYCFGWKRLRSSSPTINLILPRAPLNYVPKHHIGVSFKYFQGW